MKRALNTLLWVLSISILFVACQEKESFNQEDEYIDVQLVIKKSEVMITDEPLTTKASEGSPVYAVDIQENNPNNVLGTEQYASGVFDSMDGVSVRLKKNNTYWISVRLFYDFFSQGYRFSGRDKAINQFVYDKNAKVTTMEQYYDDFGEYVPVFKVTCDVYCGGQEFSPSNGSCIFELERATSAISIEAEGLDDGYLEVCFENISLKLTPNNTEVSTLFYDSSLGGQNSYTSIPITATYYYPDGNSIVIYHVSHNFYSCSRKRIKFILKNEDNPDVVIPFSFQIIDRSMTDEDVQSFSASI